MSHHLKRHSTSIAQSPMSVDKKLISEYRNKIYMLEIELDNERKKTIMEKDLRTKTVQELKMRFDTEKNAILNATEARFQVDKLEELNKLKENLELDKNADVNEIA